MAVVVVNNVEGGSKEFYESVNPKVMPDGQLPDGCQIHIAGPTENGWQVIGVWDSDEKFQQFRDQNLIPALREVGGDQRIAPEIKSQPVHNLITR